MSGEGLCAKCGACTTVCPVFRVTGRESHGGRGKLHLLSRLDPREASAEYAGILSRCLLCGACEAACPRGLKITAAVAAARGELSRTAGEHAFLRLLARTTLAHPELTRGVGALARFASATLPPESGLRLRLGLPATEDAMPSRPAPANNDRPPALAYFAGCFASHLEPEIGRAVAGLCEKSGQPLPVAVSGQGCCGLSAYAAGDPATAKRLARRNIAAFAGSDAPILVSCASCLSHLASYPALLADEPAWEKRATAFASRLTELATFLLAAFKARPATLPQTAPAPRRRVLYHDPCHLRFQLGITEAPRELLGRFPQLEPAELPHGPQCCGHGGLFHLAHPQLSTAIRDRLLGEAGDVELVTTTCTGCLLQWRQGLATGGRAGKAIHLALLLHRLLA